MGFLTSSKDKGSAAATAARELNAERKAAGEHYAVLIRDLSRVADYVLARNGKVAHHKRSVHGVHIDYKEHGNAVHIHLGRRMGKKEDEDKLLGVMRALENSEIPHSKGVDGKSIVVLLKDIPE